MAICSHQRPVPFPIRLLRYPAPSKVEGLQHFGASMWAEALQRAESVAHAVAALLAEGWHPDGVLAHSGWGETLGLSEVWFDNESGEALWRAVPLSLFDPERHVFRQTSVLENADNIRRIIQVIKTKKPSAKIVFTLSPVPLIATFRPIPCPVANAVSKSTLRCALDEVLRTENFSDVLYFPSYEIVTAAGANAFKDDNHHVRPEIIYRIMQYFEQYFCCP